MGSRFAEGAGLNARGVARESLVAKPPTVSQRVEDNALHQSIYVLISGGG
jgi:hypothetical protein